MSVLLVDVCSCEMECLSSWWMCVRYPLKDLSELILLICARSVLLTNMLIRISILVVLALTVTAIELGVEDYAFVSSFFDIGRGDWPDEFARSAETYLYRFSLLVQLNLPLLLFIDRRHLHTVETIIASHSETQGVAPTTIVIPIDESFLEQNVPSWQYKSVESSIMSSSEYITMAESRQDKGTPETKYSAYNCLNHAKVDFVLIALKYFQEKHIPIHFIGWVDFGYVAEPFEVEHFSMHKELLFHEHINFMIHGDMSPELADPRYVFMNTPLKIHGAFWFGSVSAVMAYHELYHECVQELHHLHIADDDQTVDICCYFKRKDLFQLWRNNVIAVIDGVPQFLWYIAFIVFNKRFVREVAVEKFIQYNAQYANSIIDINNTADLR